MTNPEMTPARRFSGLQISGLFGWSLLDNLHLARLLTFAPGE